MEKRRQILKFLLMTPLGRFVTSIISAFSFSSYIGLKIYHKNYYYMPSREIMSSEKIILPLPRLSGRMSLEEVLASRRSIREYTSDPITLEDLAQVLWAAYGISETRWGLRTAPSAGVCCCFEFYG